MAHKNDKRSSITSVTQISILTLISQTIGKFELKLYYSIEITNHPVDFTLHNILSTLCTVKFNEVEI